MTEVGYAAVEGGVHMTLETLELLRGLLLRQQLAIGAPGSRVMAAKTFAALDELEAAIIEAGGKIETPPEPNREQRRAATKPRKTTRKR